MPIDDPYPKIVERDFQQVNQFGRDQGREMSGGVKLGFTWVTQRSCNEKRTRSACTNEWGMGAMPSQRLKSSAMKLSCPGMWPTSISIPVFAASKQSFSMKKHRGRDMVNSLLLEASAPVLSESDFKHNGSRWLGKNLEVTHNSAICARVSKHVISFVNHPVE